jgi:type I restriction enzyme M protein
MWNQDWWTEQDYDADELGRFECDSDDKKSNKDTGCTGFPGKSSADWGWVQHIHASLNVTGRAAVVLDGHAKHLAS